MAFAIATAQFAPTDDRAANLETVALMTSLAAERGARIVVFPEYTSHFVNPIGPASVAAAEGLDGPFVQGVSAIAQRHDVHVVAGLVERAEGDRVANTIVALAPSGELVARYRKVHLYDAFGMRESDVVLAGRPDDLPQLFEVEGMPVGLQTCYDIRFPESSRRLVDAGAELLVVPAEWVRGPLKEHHWRTLVTARALENTVYLAAADHVPPVGIGMSMIVDPMGVVLAESAERPDLAIAWIDRARVAEVRQVNPALGLRRYAVVPASSESVGAAATS